MTAYGLLIDYEYCTNCGSCVVTCKEEHGYPVGQWGIKVLGDGPWQIDEDTWNWNWYPVLTDLCDLCADRTAEGREPACVHHCLANILTYGTIEELAPKLAAKPKQTLTVPQFKPMEAKGEFVSKKQVTHKSAHIEVEGASEVTFGAHRHDSRVGEYGEGASV